MHLDWIYFVTAPRGRGDPTQGDLLAALAEQDRGLVVLQRDGSRLRPAHPASPLIGASLWLAVWRDIECGVALDVDRPRRWAQLAWQDVVRDHPERDLPAWRGIDVIAQLEGPAVAVAVAGPSVRSTMHGGVDALARVLGPGVVSSSEGGLFDIGAPPLDPAHPWRAEGRRSPSPGRRILRRLRLG